MKKQYVTGEPDSCKDGLVFETFTTISAGEEFGLYGKNVPDEAFLRQMYWQHIWVFLVWKMLVLSVSFHSRSFNLFFSG